MYHNVSSFTDIMTTTEVFLSFNTTAQYKSRN